MSADTVPDEDFNLWLRSASAWRCSGGSWRPALRG